MKIVIKVRLDRDTLARSQSYAGSCRYGICTAVAVYCHVSICKLSAFCGIIYSDQNVSAAAVDDVFHFVPVEVHGSHLTFVDHQELFRIGFRISVVFYISVPDSDQGKTDLVKFTQSIVCNIPSQHIIADLVVFMALCLPFLRRPAAERRDLKSMSFD